MKWWCGHLDHGHRDHHHYLHDHHHHQVDLEWRCGQYTQVGNTAGHIVLQVDLQTEYGKNIALAWQDLDITSKVEANGWRKVNTIIVIVIIATNIVVITMMQVNSLAHYGVKEKALVSLVPKQIDSPSHHIYQVSQM